MFYASLASEIYANFKRFIEYLLQVLNEELFLRNGVLVSAIGLHFIRNQKRNIMVYAYFFTDFLMLGIF